MGMQPIFPVKVSITIGTIFEFGGGFDGHGGGDVVRKQTFSLTRFKTLFTTIVFNIAGGSTYEEDEREGIGRGCGGCAEP